MGDQYDEIATISYHNYCYRQYANLKELTVMGGRHYETLANILLQTNTGDLDRLEY